MRKLLNRLLTPFGYEIRRLDRFAVEIDRLLRRPDGVRFVQVGAHDGVRFDGLYPIVTAHRCAGLAIEPLPDAYVRLKAHYAPFPRVQTVNVAVHATASSAVMYRVSATASDGLAEWTEGVASFDKNHLLRHCIAERHIVAETVPCEPLMALLERYAFLNATVLQVDTEGYDADVIRMLDFARFKPRLIKYEHKNLQHADSEAVVALLRKQGYTTAADSEDTVAWLP